MKTTAVEWLVKELQKDFNIEGIQLLYDIALEKAKEMERQQIIDAYKISTIESSVPIDFKKYNSAEQYYIEKYKK